LQGIGEGLGDGIGRAVEDISDAVGRRLEMAHVPEALSLLDIEIRRAELQDADDALRRGDPKATSNAIIERSRAAGAAVTLGVGVVMLHVAHVASDQETTGALLGASAFAAGAAVGAARAVLPFC
jgi:hypothetical protein